jgi:hypothetical protein
MTYPDGIDALVNVNANDSLAAGGHAARHNSVNTALGEVKDFLGTGTGYRYNSTVYFTSNGTFTKADYPWLRAIRVRVQGGGGGAGGAGTTTSTEWSGGAGGGGGAYSERFFTDIASLDASVTVTVASGGPGGSGAQSGSTAGSSSFGASSSAWETVAVGGASGSHLPGQPFVGNARPGGAGGNGASGVGQLRISGGAGEMFQIPATGVTAISGSGGSAHLGGGALGIAQEFGGNGFAGGQYGGGGSGGANPQNQATTRTGGAGAAGIVIVELYA